MEQKFGFTSLKPTEFSSWLSNQSITRGCTHVQQHHTWKPRYANFDGTNHFDMQRSMKRFHINNNGFSDIGQHFSIFPDGRIVTGRGLNLSPACIFRANANALCIENVGNFDAGGDEMTSEQEDTIFLVTAALLKKIGISAPTPSNVVYHHWFDGNGSLVYHNSGQKTCPGTAFFGGNQLADFKANFLPKLAAKMGTGGQAPVGLLDWVMVTANQLNVRVGPSGSSAKSNAQGPLSHGTVVRVYEKSNGWFRVSQSKSLWISGRYTDRVTAATVNTADTNGRIGPGMEFEVDVVLQTGDKVFIVASEGNWRFTTNEIWIHASLLDVA